jgi:hypothetical protein
MGLTRAARRVSKLITEKAMSTITASVIKKMPTLIEVR